MMTLTKKERSVIEFILGYQEGDLTGEERSPTIREIKKGLGISSVQRIIDRLEQKRYISRVSKRWRSIKVIMDDTSMYS